MTKTHDLADLGGGFIQAGTGAVAAKWYRSESHQKLQKNQTPKSTLLTIGTE